MGVTVVFKNGTGVGKTSYMSAQVKRIVKTEGFRRLETSKAMIAGYNKKRSKPLSMPDKFPIFTNFNVEIKTGYEEFYSPYWLNPYYFGLPNQGKPVQAVVPCAAMFFTEADDVYNSSIKTPLPVAVSGIYNKNRHFKLDIWVELHRSMALHVSIRDIANKFIEIYNVKTEKDPAGRTISTTWTLREFDNWRNVEKYLTDPDGKDSKKLYTQTTYTDYGDIYKCYDCEDCAEEFIPGEGEDFSLLPQKSKVNVAELPEGTAIYYKPGAPPDFRKSDTKPPKEQKSK